MRIVPKERGAFSSSLWREGEKEKGLGEALDAYVSLKGVCFECSVGGEEGEELCPRSCPILAMTRKWGEYYAPLFLEAGIERVKVWREREGRKYKVQIVPRGEELGGKVVLLGGGSLGLICTLCGEAKDLKGFVAGVCHRCFLDYEPEREGVSFSFSDKG